MGLKKHALTAGLAATALAVAFDFSFQSTALVAITSGAAVLNKDHLKTGWDKTRETFSTFKAWASKQFHSEVKPRAKQLGAACDPRDPNNNALLGGALGAAATAVITTLTEMDDNVKLAISAGALAGGAAGAYLNDARIAKGLEYMIKGLEPAQKEEKGFWARLCDTTGTVPATAKRTKATSKRNS